MDICVARSKPKEFLSDGAVHPRGRRPRAGQKRTQNDKWLKISRISSVRMSSVLRRPTRWEFGVRYGSSASFMFYMVTNITTGIDALYVMCKKQVGLSVSFYHLNIARVTLSNKNVLTKSKVSTTSRGVLPLPRPLYPSARLTRPVFKGDNGRR